MKLKSKMDSSPFREREEDCERCWPRIHWKTPPMGSQELLDESLSIHPEHDHNLRHLDLGYVQRVGADVLSISIQLALSLITFRAGRSLVIQSWNKSTLVENSAFRAAPLSRFGRRSAAVISLNKKRSGDLPTHAILMWVNTTTHH